MTFDSQFHKLLPAIKFLHMKSKYVELQCREHIWNKELYFIAERAREQK